MANELIDLVFTSASGGAMPGFYGYAFQGTDFVIGQEGFDRFVRSGRTFDNEADGGYLRIEALDIETWKFSTDFRGYFPLFYYALGTEWIISPSFELVVKEAHRRGWPLTLRKHQLTPWKSPWAFVQMLTSKRTAFNEIYGAGYDEEIIVGAGGLAPKKRQLPIANTTYKDALEDLIATWGARVMSLVRNGMTLRVDLTGGVDSRTVMAFLLDLLQRNGAHDLLKSPSFLVNSQPNKPEDFSIAQAIGAAFDFPVNNPERKGYILVSDTDSFTAWRQYNLGRYSPHILPLPALDSGIITFNGIGGEEHRPFYDSFGRGSFGSFLTLYRQLFASDAQYGAWLADLLEDIDAPITLHDAQQPAATRHYRRHRSRHHTSKQPANEMMGVFLSSRLAFECAHHMTREAVEANQLLFDIMINCQSELAIMAYDKPGKEPKTDNFANLTRIEHSLSRPSGRIWRAERKPGAGKIEGGGRNTVLREEVLRALDKPGVVELLGEDQRQAAMRQIAMLTPTNNLHQSGHLLHYVLMVELVVDHRTG